MSETKPSNPKDLIGVDKLPFHLWPKTATALGCLGLLDGMLKYGRTNWRVAGVRASIYADALERHMGAWFEGEDCDPDSGLPHLAHALACLAILVDAHASGTMTDDRMVAGRYRQYISNLTPEVKKLKEKRRFAHIDPNMPKHYTIEDSRNIPTVDPAFVSKEQEQDWQQRLDEYNAKLRQWLKTPDVHVIDLHNEDMRHEDIEGDKEYWGV